MHRMNISFLIVLIFQFFNVSWCFNNNIKTDLDITTSYSSIIHLLIEYPNNSIECLQLLQNEDSLKMFAVKEIGNLFGISNVELLYDNDLRENINANKNENIMPDLLSHNQNLKINLTENKYETDGDSTLTKKERQIKLNKNYKSSCTKKDSLIRDDVELETIIVDQTQSKLGKDFFDSFNDNWNPPEKNNSYTIVIEEKVLPRLGTFILIEIDGNDIYQSFIQPRYESIEENAVEGVNVTLAYLANYEEIQLELQGEDLKGTGIF